MVQLRAFFSSDLSSCETPLRLIAHFAFFLNGFSGFGVIFYLLTLVVKNIPKNKVSLKKITPKSEKPMQKH